MKKPEIGKWEISLRSNRDYMRMERGWRILSLACFKWREIPGEGARIHKDHYWGIFVNFAYWLPVESV